MSYIPINPKKRKRMQEYVVPDSSEHYDQYYGGVSGTPAITTVDLTGLISHWKLDEGIANNRADSHGTNILSEGGVAGEVGSNTGIIGNAASFIAADDSFLERATNATLETGDIDFTLCAWVFLSVLPGAGQWAIISKWTLGNLLLSEYRLVHEAGDHLFEWQVTDGANVGAVEHDSGDIVINTWYFVVCQHDSVLDRLSMSINGSAFTYAAYTFGGNVGASSFRIGTENATDDKYINGRVDSVSFFKRLLTDVEIDLLYNAGAGFDYPFGN